MLRVTLENFETTKCSDRRTRTSHYHTAACRTDGLGIFVIYLLPNRRSMTTPASYQRHAQILQQKSKLTFSIIGRI